MPSPTAMRIAVLLLVLAGMGAGRVPPDVDREQFLEAAGTILCDCGCHPQSVYDCECGRAAEMRADIAGEIRGGKTGAQVIDDYVARFGEKIRIAPEATGFNLVAWVGPGVAFVLAVLGVLFLLRRWQTREPVEVGAGGSATVAVDSAYVDRVNDELREYDR